MEERRPYGSSTIKDRALSVRGVLGLLLCWAGAVIGPVLCTTIILDRESVIENEHIDRFLPIVAEPVAAALIPAMIVGLLLAPQKDRGYPLIVGCFASFVAASGWLAVLWHYGIHK